MRTRREHDSLGPVEVPEDRLWGAQTQRSLENFPIGRGRFVWGRPVIRAFGLLKKAAALANMRLGQLPSATAEAIARAADEVICRQARCRISAGRVPDRLGHAIQHERERGDRPPRRPDCSAASSDSPERRRQPQPVVERRVPGGHAHRRRRWRSRADLLPALGRIARRARRARPCPGRHRDDRAHASDGRDAA